MNYVYRYSLRIIYSLILLAALTPAIVFAQLEYSPLVETGITSGGDFSDYINNLYYLAIGLAALLAVIKIVIAGVKWMLSDVVTDKSSAKKDIRGALLGLVLILGAVIILNTINPQLTQVEVGFEGVGASPFLNPVSGGADLGCLTDEEEDCEEIKVFRCEEEDCSGDSDSCESGFKTHKEKSTLYCYKE